MNHFIRLLVVHEQDYLQYANKKSSIYNLTGKFDYERNNSLYTKTQL